MSINPFKIHIPPPSLTLLTQKLQTTRLPPPTQHGESNHVTSARISALLTHWRTTYSWRDEEARLNRIPQFTTPIETDGFGPLEIHFIHSRSSKAGAMPTTPLLFLHGWPGNCFEVEKMLPGLNERGFDVVAPSLPGFGFSAYPEKAAFKVEHVAGVMRGLMRRLGYGRFVVQGGDWGSWVGRAMAVMFPGEVVGVHLNMFVMPKPDFPSGEPTYTPFEQKCLDRCLNWFMKDQSAYFMIQGSKPRTLGFAMHDSPVGMLAWMCDKLFLWSDDYPWTPDELITWTLMHYFPGPTTAFQMYFENSPEELSHTSILATGFIKVPTGVSAFPKELGVMPRSWVERKAKVVWWREHEDGGHFAAYERPEVLVGDIVDFVEKISKQSCKADASHH